MSHVRAGDPRAHTTPAEKDRHAKQLVEHANRLILEDQPGGVGACQECMGSTMMLAVGEAIQHILEFGDPAERIGLAQRIDRYVENLKHSKKLLLLSGMMAINDQKIAA